jgi:hypothetical protein
MVKKIILIIVGLIAAVALFYVALYSYFMLQFMFTWQCKIYDGHDFNAEQVKICNDYNSGGLYKVLTN